MKNLKKPLEVKGLGVYNNLPVAFYISIVYNKK